MRPDKIVNIVHAVFVVIAHSGGQPVRAHVPCLNAHSTDTKLYIKHGGERGEDEPVSFSRGIEGIIDYLQ